ncbi:putative mitochondrial protein AtMg00860 [Silene latifolia]|uniref:putative mitochondrial protein AtMg00860 n=1 Tax=Silene latifolia TaxID=37657 RepID=UPI003D77EB68
MVVYLDDIVVYNHSLAEHVEHMRLVFAKLRDNHLFVKKEKCDFAQPEVKFLGHIVGKRELRIDPKNITAIKEWDTPRNVFELRSFLGLANYYQGFIREYSKIAAPLTDLMKKDVKWE